MQYHINFFLKHLHSLETTNMNLTTMDDDAFVECNISLHLLPHLDLIMEMVKELDMGVFEVRRAICAIENSSGLYARWREMVEEREIDEIEALIEKGEGMSSPSAEDLEPKPKAFKREGNVSHVKFGSK